MSNIYSTSKVSYELSILKASNDPPFLSGMTLASTTQRANVEVFEDKVSQVIDSSSLENNTSEKQLILKSTQPPSYALPEQIVDHFDSPASEIPQRNELMMEVKRFSKNYHRMRLSGFLSYGEYDILKKFEFDVNSMSVSQLSLDNQSQISKKSRKSKSNQNYRAKDSEENKNDLPHGVADSTSVKADDLPLHLRFSKTISSALQEIGSQLDKDSQNVSAVSRKRQRTSNIQALETSCASPQPSPVVSFKKRKPSEHREGLGGEQLVMPQPCMLPHNMACLFVEVCSDDYTDEVRAAALRHLLAHWSGAMETEASSGISKSPRVESSTPSLPPPYRRLIVLMADNASALEKSLLWWTLRPYAEHALILPIFGICPIEDDDEFSACASISKKSSDPKETQKGKRTVHQNISKGVLSTNAMQAVMHNGQKRGHSVKLALLQTVALHHLCDSFAVNPSNSYALCYSKTCWNALKTLGIPIHHMKHTLKECARCIVKVCAGVTKTSRKSQNAGNVDFGLWIGSAAAAQQYRRTGSSVDEQRELIFSYLCSWNGLAQTLATNARRPELVLRVLKMLHAPISSYVLSARICYALVRPVSRQELCFACAISREMRLFASQSPLVVLPTGSGELFRSFFFNFLSTFFTPSVFRTAVDVVRSSSSDYIKGYSCSTLGYLQFEVSSWMRQYIYVSLAVDLRPIIFNQARNNSSGMSPWSSVLRALQCSCTPRQNEKTLLSENGERKCRHHAELLYYFANRQINNQHDIQQTHAA